MRRLALLCIVDRLFALFLVAVAMLLVHEQSRIIVASSPDALHPGQLGERRAEAVVAVGAVRRESAPGEPLNEAVDSEAGVERLQGEEQMDAARPCVSDSK